MAIRKPLVWNGTMVEQLQSGDTIEVPSTGVDVVNLEASVALALGDVVYVSAAGAVAKSQANAAGTAKVIGMARAAIESAATGPIQTDGILSGLTGLTAGLPYYLSADTAGTMVTTAPSESGKFVTKLGTAISTTELEISIREPIKL